MGRRGVQAAEWGRSRLGRPLRRQRPESEYEHRACYSWVRWWQQPPHHRQRRRTGQREHNARIKAMERNEAKLADELATKEG